MLDGRNLASQCECINSGCMATLSCSKAKAGTKCGLCDRAVIGDTLMVMCGNKKCTALAVHLECLGWKMINEVYVWDDEDLYLKIQKNISKFLNEKFSWQKHVESLLIPFYEKLLH